MVPSFRSVSMILAFVLPLFASIPAIAEIDEASVRTRAEGMSDDALSARAAELKSAVEAGEAEVAELKTAADEASDADKAAADEAVAAKEAEVDDLVAELQIVVPVLKDRGADIAVYQSFLLERGGFSLDNLSGGAVVDLFGRWADKAKTWAIEKGPTYIIKAVLFIFVLFVFRILSSMAGRVVRTSLEVSKLKAPALLKEFFVNVATKVTMLVGFLIGLMVIDVPIAPLLAGIGVLGFVVGFALQDTLANFASGIMLLLYRPYDVGDFVTAGGVTGSVSSMSLVSTTLTTPDNQVEVVPNGKIWGDCITNVTANSTRRIDLVMGIGYDDDIDKAEKVIHEVVTSHPSVLKDPEPAIKLNELADSSVNFVVRPWVKTGDYWPTRWDLLKQLKLAFDREGINIPYPQRDVHVKGGSLGNGGA